jgi:hypothetical protein
LRVERVEEVRELARHGALATAMSTATGADRMRLTGATYDIAWPVVFNRLTHGMELRRGHATCARSVRHLADDCLDRFEDDVEAVVDDVERRADRPIDNLEAWIASRLTAATVDAHRRRRGERGALQRPRLPRWLIDGLAARDQQAGGWLVELATNMLVWVGTPTTAGADVWPLESWAQQRERWPDPPAHSIEHDVDTVLAVMRTRRTWFDRYVERPLGRKQPPVAGPLVATDGSTLDRPPLSLVDRDDADDASLHVLASLAADEIRCRLRYGEEPEPVVMSVIWRLFGVGDVTRGLDRTPHDVPHRDEWLASVLRDPAERARVVRAVLTIVDQPSCDYVTVGST